MKTLTKTALAAVAIASVMGMSSAQAAVITSYTNAIYGGFDSSSGTRSVTVAPGLGSILDVNIAVEFSKCDDPFIGAGGGACIGDEFSFDREIVFRLTSPGGTEISLIEEDTYSGSTPGAGRLTITFDDEASSAVGGAVLTGGSFTPVEALSLLDAESAIGLWTLFIEDTVGADPLEFFSFTLSLTTADVPEPMTLSLLGAGLAGIGLARRKRA